MASAKEQGYTSFICIILLYILMNLSSLMMQELADLHRFIMNIKAHHLKPF